MPARELLRLLQRQAALEKALGGRGGTKMTEERELLKLRETLDANSGPARMLLAAALRVGGPLEEIPIRDLQIHD